MGIRRFVLILTHYTMSRSKQTEVHPDESISQVNLSITLNSDDNHDEDIHCERVGLSVPSKTSLSSEVGISFSTHPAYFKVTEQTLVEARTFLKDPWKSNGFKFRIEGERELPSTTEGGWVKFYEAVHRTNGQPFALCLYCHQKYTHPWCYKSKPTRSLTRHALNCRIYHRSEGSQPSTITSFFHPNQQRHIKKTDVEDQVLKFFISANIPFKQADNDHFRELVSWIQINNQPARPPSRKVIRARLSNKAETAKDDLKTILSANRSKISLALDCWTTRTNFSFLAITGPWIDDDWKLHEALLDFRHVEGHHYGEHLAEHVFEVLEEYEICEKLFGITTDGAGNNGTMCKALSKRLKDDKNIKWDPKQHHIACMNHVINLAVQSFLKSIKGIQSNEDEEELDYKELPDEEPLPEGFSRAMWKIRSITKAITASNIRMERFKEVCEFVKLTALKMIYDVITRWDSAYKMLSRALYLRKAIDHYVAEDEDLQKFILSKKEWDQASIVCTILMPFKMASQRLQATKRPGIDSVFWDYESLFNKIDAVKETLTQPIYSDKEWIQELHAGVEKLSEKLAHYYSKTNMPFVYPDACILEPVGKLILFKQERFGGGNAGQWVEKYKKGCYERYIKEYEPILLEDSNPRKRQREESSSDEDDIGDYRSFLHKQSRQTTAENELDRYLSMPAPPKRIKTLDYWRDHISDFPHLNIMARDTFAVPATGAGVERRFSQSGRVASWTRAQLHSDTISETMLYREYLDRIGQPLNQEAEKRRVERRRERKKNQEAEVEQDHSDSDEDEEEPALIKWELEWWKQPGAVIIN